MPSSRSPQSCSAVTGAEALYADMGHFGRSAITRGWLVLVLPACTLNYFGQGALLLGDEATVSAPFFLLTPGWARLPMVLLATAATVIASQAVITGAYSVASQAAQLGYCRDCEYAHLGVDDRPDLRAVDQLAADGRGAHPGVRVPQLGGAGLRLRHGGHRHDHHHHAAVLLHRPATRWQTPLWLVVIGGGALLLVDLMFVAANLTKLVHGAWLPLLIGVVAFTVMTTWQRGREIVTRAREKAEGPLREFVDGLSDSSAAVTADAGHGGVPQPRERDQRPWRCGPTSSTTTCSTNT